MKKLLSLLLAAGTCLSLCMAMTACNQETDPQDTTNPPISENGDTLNPDQVATPDDVATEDVGVTDQQWTAMLDLVNFGNYTLNEYQDAKYETGTETMDHTIFKVAGDKASVKLFVGKENEEYIVFTDEEAAAQKESYEMVYRALLADFDNFAYDSTDQSYKNTKPVTAEFPMEIYEIYVTIVMENSKVKLSDDGKLLEFECDAKQTTVTPTQTVLTELHVKWVFSDYGTTVITDTAE